MERQICTEHEDEDTDWNDVEAKEKQRRPANQQKQGRGLERCLPHALRKTYPADTLVLDFQPPELWDNTFLLFKPLSLW